MIHPKEINAIAAKYKLKDTQVEKDYVLTWVLVGISQNQLLSKALVFKGGTALKKIYFEDYRFSEDLDFTLLDEKISNEEILKEFEKIYSFVKESANITLQFKEMSIHSASGSMVFYVNYSGPLQANINNRDIKIDITRGEILEFQSETRKEIGAYSDEPIESFSLLCYSLPEILIEKMAALMGRTEPRDLFDFWYLTQIEGLRPKDFKQEFERKAKNKKHNPNHFSEKVLSKEKNLKRAWEEKLENQIHDLEKFDDIYRQIKKHLKL